MAGPKAIVAGSGFGCRIHVPALRAAGFEVAGLVGTDAERTARAADAAGIPAAFTDLDEAIARTGAVAVTIASPPATHAALAHAAIARGCHVLCEKPMAADPDEARAMLAAAEAAGVTHLIGNEFRWSPERAIIARAIAEGLIGEPRLLTLVSTMPLVADPAKRMPGWWFDRAAGGGWLGAHGSHLIDQVHGWIGGIASLGATLPSVADRGAQAAEDSYVVHFTAWNGAEGVLQHSAGAWGPAESVSRVAGTKGTVWVEGGAVRLADASGTRDLPVPPELVLPEVPPTGDARVDAARFELPPFIRLCEILRAACDGRAIESAVPPPTFRDGVAAMAVIEAIRQSAAAGGARVTL